MTLTSTSWNFHIDNEAIRTDWSYLEAHILEDSIALACNLGVRDDETSRFHCFRNINQKSWSITAHYTYLQNAISFHHFHLIQSFPNSVYYLLQQNCSLVSLNECAKAYQRQDSRFKSFTCLSERIIFPELATQIVHLLLQRRDVIVRVQDNRLLPISSLLRKRTQIRTFHTHNLASSHFNIKLSNSLPVRSGVQLHGAHQAGAQAWAPNTSDQTRRFVSWNCERSLFATVSPAHHRNRKLKSP